MKCYVQLVRTRKGNKMSVNNIGDFLGMIGLIALATTLVVHKETANDTKAVGGALDGFLGTAMGQKNGGGY